MSEGGSAGQGNMGHSRWGASHFTLQMENKGVKLDDLLCHLKGLAHILSLGDFVILKHGFSYQWAALQLSCFSLCAVGHGSIL